jgi:flagellar L-ring protein precursor FlgH
MNVARRPGVASRRAVAGLCGALVAGCAGPATTYKFPQRQYQAGEYDVDVAAERGLLWGEHTADMVADNRSARLGDLVIVEIDENADATSEGATNTSTQSSVQAGVSNFFGALEKFAKDHPNVSLDALVKAAYSSSYQGAGTTSRKGTLTATIPCQVKQVLPNGDLFIEGTKAIQVNREEVHLYLSGVVRPIDIDMANTVASSRVLDARIDFSGRGVVSDKQGPGILHRAADRAWPF